MDDIESIRYLITALKNPSNENNATAESQILNNIVYFTPRLRDVQVVSQLIQVFFQWKPRWLTIWDIFKASSSIMQWKLEISEPQINIHTFVSLWKQEIGSYRALNCFQISIVAGLVSSHSQLNTLQKQLYIDDSGIAEKELHDLKYRHFLPYWKQQLIIARGNPHQTDDLCVLYSMIHSKLDNDLPHDIIFSNLFDILVDYIKNANMEYSGRNAFAYQHINLLCKTCADSIPHLHNHSELLMGKMITLHDITKKLTAKASLSKKGNYTGKYYTNCLFIVVLLLSGYRPDPSNVSIMTFTLYYTSFILQDFGLDGFSAYQSLIHSLCNVTSQDLKIFDSILTGMVSQVSFDMENKVYHSMMLFILEYLQLNMSLLEIPDAQYLTERIEPLIGPLLSSTDIKLRESAHLVWLELYNNDSWKPDIVEFKLKRIRVYLRDCFQGCQKSFMTKEQLLLVWKSMLPIIRHLSNYDINLVRDLIHSTYLNIINSENLEMKSIGIECLVEQLYNVPEKYLWDWLNTCKQLIEGQPPVMRDILFTKLWEFVSHAHNELAIRWWYDAVVPTLSRF